LTKLASFRTFAVLPPVRGKGLGDAGGPLDPIPAVWLAEGRTHSFTANVLSAWVKGICGESMRVGQSRATPSQM
jgi:hypothetical protein